MHTSARRVAHIPMIFLAAAFAVVLCGCGGTRSITFDLPEFQLIQEDWEFRGRPGKAITTDHFEIYTTLGDEVLREYLPGFLETTYRFYTSLLAPPEDSIRSQRMTTYVFENRLQWDAFTKQHYPARWALYRKISAGGFAEGGSCVTYNIGRSNTLSVLAHEGWHQYVGSRFPDPIPAWVNEGLATYCEAVEFHGDTPHFTPQHNTFRINHLRSALAAGETLSVAELLDTDAGQVIDESKVALTNTYYAQSWALVVYLRHGGDRRYAEGFEKMLEGLRNGTIRIETQAARMASASPAQTSYGAATFYAYITDDLETFDIGYKNFLEQMCYSQARPSLGAGWLESLSGFFRKFTFR